MLGKLFIACEARAFQPGSCSPSGAHSAFSAFMSNPLVVLMALFILDFVLMTKLVFVLVKQRAMGVYCL